MQRQSNRKPLALAALGLILLAGGCALLQKSAPAGYAPRSLDYSGYDFSVLQGQRIVLDPGHGGQFSGALGPTGLAEKDVNLAVALVLRDLLAGYGASVTLTRSTDIDLLPPGAKGPLHADLQARVDSSLAADSSAIFLSIHHNSPGAPGSRYNATETYYKLGDTGPSLDLARFIQAQLAANVGLPRIYLRPGNYYILRHNPNTAVLGEASYLSNPGTEKKLRGEAALKLEAYSYLLGLVDYLSHGVPLVESLAVNGGRAEQELEARISARVVEEKRGRGIDPQAIQLTVDGSPVEFSYNPDGGRLEARVAGLDNGNHLAAVRVRNLRGNAAREAIRAFRVEIPTAQVRILSSLSKAPLDGVTPVRFTAVATDTRGRPVADSTWMLLEFSDPNIPPRTLMTRAGQVSVAVVPAANKPLSLRASCGDISGQANVQVGEISGTVLVLQVSDSLDRGLAARARVSVPGAGVFNCDDSGWLTLTGLPPGPCRLRLECPGCLPQTLEPRLENGRGRVVRVILQPVLGGALLGQKISLDPAAGGDIPGETGALGSRESDINYGVALFLKDYLERAGATVFVTRGLEESPGVWDRVIRAEDFGGAVLVSISHSGRGGKKDPAVPTLVSHYPASPEGGRLAGLIAARLKGFAGRPWRGSAPGYQRLLQQVGCPAVQVRAASVADPAAESLLCDPIYQRREAQALFEALAAFFGFGPGDSPSRLSGRVSDGRGGVVEGALVWLDGWLPTQTDREGRFFFDSVAAGPHPVTVQYRDKVYGPSEGQPGRNMEILLGGE